MKNSIDNTATSICTDYSKRTENDIQSLIFKLSGLTEHPIILSNNINQIGPFLKKKIQEKTDFDVISYISLNGYGITSTGKTGNCNNRDYFKKCMQTKQAVISNPLVSQSTGNLSVVLAVPVKKNGQMTGIIVGTVSLNRLSSMIKKMHFLQTGYGEIIDNTGLVVAHSISPEQIGKMRFNTTKIDPSLNLSDKELDPKLVKLFKIAQSGQQSEGEYTFSGKNRLAVMVPISLPEGQRWVVSVAAPETEIYHQVSHLGWLMLGISIICLLIAIIVVLVKKFSEPLVLLSKESLHLSEEDLHGRPLDINSKDEIGELANGFKTMQQNLRELVTKVRGQSENLAVSSEQLTAQAHQSSQAVNQVADSIAKVAEGANNQLKAANDTAAVMQEVSEQIRNTANAINKIAINSSQASIKAEEGSKAIKKRWNKCSKYSLQ